MRTAILLIVLMFVCPVARATDYCASAVGCWLFREGSGTTVEDSSPNSNTGNFRGAGEPVWSTTGLPKSYMSAWVDFDGSNDYVSFAGTSQTSTSFTVWVNLDVISNYPRIIVMPGLTFQIRSDRPHIGLASTRSSTNGDWEQTVTDLQVSTNYHLSITYDSTSTSNSPIPYINGVQQGITTLVPPSGTQTANNGTSYFGNRADGTRPFNGRIGEIGNFNTILSSTDINDIMDNGLSPSAVTIHTNQLLNGQWFGIMQ